MIKKLLIAVGILLICSPAFSAGNDANTIVLLHMNGVDASTTFTDDAAGGAYTWTAQGTAQIDTAQNKFDGASGLMDGDSDYINSSSLALTSTTTIECWVRPAAATHTGGIISDYANANANWDLYLNAGVPTFKRNRVGVEDVTLVASTVLSINTWYHIAVVENGSAWVIYVNGTSEGTDTQSDAWQGLSGTFIGKGQNFTTAYFNGHIDEVRVSNIARWTANFTTEVRSYNGNTLPNGNDSYTVSLIHANTDFTDSAYNGTHTWTSAGLPTIDNVNFEFGGGSAGGFADTANSYLEAADSADWDFGTGDWTIDLWAKATGTATDTMWDSGTTTDGVCIRFNWSTSIIVYVQGISHTFATTLSLNTWYHIAVVRYSGTIMCFQDGVQIGSTEAETGNVTVNSAVRVGGAIDSSWRFVGNLDEIRVSKGYARWIANFTPPTSEYGDGTAIGRIISINQ